MADIPVLEIADAGSDRTEQQFSEMRWAVSSVHKLPGTVVQRLSQEVPRVYLWSAQKSLGRAAAVWTDNGAIFSAGRRVRTARGEVC